MVYSLEGLNKGALFKSMARAIPSLQLAALCNYSRRAKGGAPSGTLFPQRVWYDWKCSTSSSETSSKGKVKLKVSKIERNQHLPLVRA